MITDNKEVIIMSEVTAPIMTDATGQSIDSKLNSLLGKMDDLAAAFQPNASGIVYSNTTSGLTGDDVQEAIDEMAADVSEIKSSLSQKANKNWTLFSTTVPTAGNPTPLPDEFDELLISVSFNAPNGWHSSEFLIPKELLSSTSVKHAAGWYYSASDCASFMVQLDNTEITQVSTTRGGQSITAYMQAYYR